MEIDEFIFEVKEEISSYEEFGTKRADEWEKTFLDLLNKNKIKKNIKSENGKTFYLINDESDIFGIVDKFCDAIEQNCIEQYWKNF